MTGDRFKTIFVGNSLRNFSYLIRKENSDYFCVDPFDAMGIKIELEKIGGNLIGIINTHQHFDHICGNPDLQHEFNVPIYAHYQAEYEVSFEALKQGDEIELDHGGKLVIWETPGHTHTHICLNLWEKETHIGIFSGDTLFNAGVGHCKLGGDPEVLHKTITETFSELEDHVEIYPGHEYMENNLKFTLSIEDNSRASSMLKEIKGFNWKEGTITRTMGDERAVNSFLRLNCENLKKKFPNKNEREIFLTLRELRNNW